MPVINGIEDACGVRIYDLPATPKKVKEAWQKLQNGEDLTPPKYFFGTEFEDELEYIRENPIEEISLLQGTSVNLLGGV